ncbi:MAG: septum formation initiator family protein [Acidimicrobiales bacterium]
MALVVGVVLVATEFPWHQLLDERAGVARSSQQLTQLQNANHALQAEVNSLHQSSTIEGVAHSQYGLVEPGQRSVVVLAGGGTGAKGPLSATKIPESDIVPSDSLVAGSGTGGAAVAGSHPSGFWGQLLQRLEFWKAAQ